MDFDAVVFRLLMPVHHSRWRALHPHIMGDIAVALYVPISPIGHKRAHKSPRPSSAGVRRCAVGGDGGGDGDGGGGDGDGDCGGGGGDGDSNGGKAMATATVVRRW